MPIETYLNQQVQIKARTGVDKYGKPQLGSASTIEARFVERTNVLRDPDGKEYTTDAEVWVKPTQSIALEDVIVYDSTNYKVVKIETRRDFEGLVDHKKAILARTKE